MLSFLIRLPARNQSKNTPDSLDAGLFRVDGIAHTVQSLSITVSVQPLVRFRVMRNDQPFPLAHSQRMDGDAKHPCGCTDWVQRFVP